MMTMGAHVFPPDGWLDESPSSEMHEQQVRLRCALSGGIGRMKGGLMGSMVDDRSGRSGDAAVLIPVWRQQRCIYSSREAWTLGPRSGAVC